MPDDSGFDTRMLNGGLIGAALAGLLRSQKTLPAALFYDEEGCRLFYRITALPEYYLTRTERALLSAVAPQVLADIPPRTSASPAPGTVLVEYGASDEGKAALLLNACAPHAPAIAAYVPIDVAMTALRGMRARLALSHPHLSVYPLTADFMDPVTLPVPVSRMARLGFFPGSTIGNMNPSEARRFLSLARSTLGSGSRFLVGTDLRKDPSILLPAYDDAEGVTAAFNRNMLVRLNREAAADFDPAAFGHRAVWNDAESRIEMHLVSLCDQTVRIAGRHVPFARGDTIHTENSYKHTPAAFAAIAADAGWGCAAMWTDPEQLFALWLLRPSPGPSRAT